MLCISLLHVTYIWLLLFSSRFCICWVIHFIYSYYILRIESVVLHVQLSSLIWCLYMLILRSASGRMLELNFRVIIYLFIIKYFRRIVAAGVQPVSDPTSNIASLCVFYNALCWWMCRGSRGGLCPAPKVTRCGTYKASVNIGAFSISGSCVTRTMRTPKNKGWMEFGLYSYSCFTAIYRVLIILTRNVVWICPVICQVTENERLNKTHTLTYKNTNGYRSIRDVQLKKARELRQTRFTVLSCDISSSE